jgi:hypothetical protein
MSYGIKNNFVYTPFFPVGCIVAYIGQQQQNDSNYDPDGWIVCDDRILPNADTDIYNDLSDILSLVSKQVTPIDITGYNYTYNVSSLPYTYTVSASSEINADGFRTYNAFDKIDTTSWWSNGSGYNQNGNYTGGIITNYQGGSVSGQWLQIKFPFLLQLQSYVIKSNNNGFQPQQFTVLGSLNGNDWIFINTVDAFYTSSYTSIVSPAPSKYCYFRIVISKLNAFFDSSEVVINSWEINGFLNTFPNLNAAFLRGAGSRTFNSTNYSATLNNFQDDSFKTHNHEMTFNPKSEGGRNQRDYAIQFVTGREINTINTYVSDNNTINENETRPFNMGVKWIIKY